jgi:hypothetical protein
MHVADGAIDHAGYWPTLVLTCAEARKVWQDVVWMPNAQCGAPVPSNTSFRKNAWQESLDLTLVCAEIKCPWQ